ncbi:DivIVA domain-containing protein [Rhizohabitans arisaemae]|uniref:DivIVA domain-containing protein n=1 Tax=Rhizohabitans arisaemae TaxID=2720610 RepID=UPI0024B0DC02|nr:DivIVA domain-containing protein [Rhizohabitans arisaemae]
MFEGHEEHDSDAAPGETPGGRLSPRPATGLLTPADVRGKVFTTVRLREGYDLGEVDAFLRQVETALTLLIRENADLNDRLAGSAAGSPDVSPPANRALWIITLAQETADKAVTAAREEACGIVAAARAHAEEISRHARDVHHAERERERAGEEARRLFAEHGARLRDALEDQIHRLRAVLTELDGEQTALTALTSPQPASPPAETDPRRSPTGRPARPARPSGPAEPPTLEDVLAEGHVSRPRTAP